MNSASEYTTRELDLHFKDIKEALCRIEAQTMRTNGRVSALEKWRYTIVGGMIVLGALNIPNIKALISVIQ